MEHIDADSIRIGIDIGGTFTDFVIYTPSTGKIDTLKILSTPHNPANAVLAGIARLRLPPGLKIIHGSTVATNALLERKGAKTALITTQGFKDILLIGRQNRPILYDWSFRKPDPLIPSEISYEIHERVDCEGKVIEALHEQDLDGIIQSLQDNNVKSVAIAFLFSFLHPEHERVIAERLRAADFFVSASSEVLPEYREYERTSTTAVNAYVTPILNQYLSTLSASINDAQLQVMQSNGGMIGVEKARENGVRCILSGPAGGVIGAQYLTRFTQSIHSSPNENKHPIRIITFDMGGTSTDVSLIDGSPSLTSESSVGGCPISIPVIDIHTIGAGGGSIAYLDPGGALRVGPHSAGADPGPACYGKGNLPTVTDANVVLGRLVPEYFLGGSMNLDPERSRDAIRVLGSKLGMDVTQCAMGIITVANAHMEHALRVISVERGYDPRDFTLFAFGGAGGLHAAELARNLMIPRITISPYASVLSAFGMLAADIVIDYGQTVMLSNSTTAETIKLRFQPLIKQGENDLRAQGVTGEQASIQLFVDCRYQGQSYELTIPYNLKWDQAFHQAHQRAYGFHSPQTPIELVNIRVRAIGFTSHPMPRFRLSGDSNPVKALIGYREIFLRSQSILIPCYQHDILEPGNVINGPAMIIRPDTTILVDTQDIVNVDCINNLQVRVG
jgi:N-methylhydantoinase A